MIKAYLKHNDLSNAPLERIAIDNDMLCTRIGRKRTSKQEKATGKQQVTPGLS
jgi:hypothetical protein